MSAAETSKRDFKTRILVSSNQLSRRPHTFVSVFRSTSAGYSSLYCREPHHGFSSHPTREIAGLWCTPTQMRMDSRQTLCHKCDIFLKKYYTTQLRILSCHVPFSFCSIFVEPFEVINCFKTQKEFWVFTTVAFV